MSSSRLHYSAYTCYAKSLFQSREADISWDDVRLILISKIFVPQSFLNFL